MDMQVPLITCTTLCICFIKFVDCLFNSICFFFFNFVKKLFQLKLNVCAAFKY